MKIIYSWNIRTIKKWKIQVSIFVIGRVKGYCDIRKQVIFLIDFDIYRKWCTRIVLCRGLILHVSTRVFYWHVTPVPVKQLWNIWVNTIIHIENGQHNQTKLTQRFCLLYLVMFTDPGCILILWDIIIIIIIAYLYSANFICVSRHNAQKRFIVFNMD